MKTCDAIVVLGGGVWEGGALPPWVIKRFDRALELSLDAPILCLSAGTVHHPPPLNAEGYPFFESAAGAAHLIARGVATERIQVETVSYDTIGNAYFSKLLHIDPEGWRRLIVITSEFHMERTQAIFEWVFGMEAGKYELQFEASPNDGFGEEKLWRRRHKEAAALAALGPVMARVQDLKSLHRWIYTEHQAYTAQGWTARRASAPSTAEIY